MTAIAEPSLASVGLVLRGAVFHQVHRVRAAPVRQSAAPLRAYEPVRTRRRRPFDKAIMASVLHHFSDAEAAAVLAQLARMVRARLVVMDLDPDSANRFQGFLIAHDRGRFVRPPARQRAIFAERFHVVAERRFVTAWRMATHTLFVCEPR